MAKTRKSLINYHLCKKNITKRKESVGYEVYTTVDTPFQLNKQTLSRFYSNFQKKNNKWFKFVIFSHNNHNYIYVINGKRINKHSICALKGLLDVTKDTGEYDDMRKVYNALVRLKGDNKNRAYLRNKLNMMINKYIPCMPVISAGSGTVNEDGSICINTKSGHYKPTKGHIEFAKGLFEKLTDRNITVELKADKELLKEKYGDKYMNYTGICL